MGIGAYQAREFARKMGGEVSVESEAGIGTTFVLSLSSVLGCNLHELIHRRPDRCNYLLALMSSMALRMALPMRQKCQAEHTFMIPMQSADVSVMSLV